MFERRPSFKLCLALGLLCFSSVASAQVKPRFVIAFDTSGSMIWDLAGNTTYGDGVGRPAMPGDDPALVRNGVFYGCGTTAGLDRNCDGLPNDSRIAIAKEAVRNMVAGFGDVEWALARFHQAQGVNLCSNYGGTGSCTAQTYGNPQCNTGDADNDGCVGAIPDACEPGVGGNDDLRVRTSSDFDGCFNYDGADGCGFSCTNNPDCATGDMLVGFPQLDAFDGRDNRSAILKWMDNVETNFINSAVSGHFCDHANAGNCELRPTGWTPLGGILDTALDYVASVRPDDMQSSCRPYSVILLTDGAETCSSDPVGRATALLGQNVRTYVVGVSIASADQASLNSIAANGGTTSAYFANSPTELAAALSQIVNDSLVFETCNGLDDDCDGEIDEDLPQGQPGSAPQPEALFCDGEGQRTAAQNTQVNQRLDPDVAQTAAITDPIVCGRVPDDCTNSGVDDDCDGANDEDAPDLTACGTCPGAVDICNGIDDDCDGTYDEGTGGEPFSACPIECTEDAPCGSNVGECRPGVYRCIDGVLDSTCFGETVGTDEVCDELDNNCDGIVDNPATLAQTCTTAYGDTGICQPGTQFCARPSIGETADAMGYRVDAMGNPVCVGQVLPDDREICDALDHDCDGNAFTCTSPTCTVGPEPAFVGNTCGLGVGICTGTLECDENGNPDGGPPVLVCNAPSAAPDETCNNIDDDCDGSIDEDAIAGNDLGGNPGGANGDFCGSVTTDEGVCNRGRYQCTNGFWQCAGEVGPSTEICDNVDNDCDGFVDADDPDIDDPRIGQQCGTSIGECEPGTSVCTGGAIVCTPVQGPVAEECDGLDNDCDNLIDEQLPDTLPPLGERDIVPCGDDTGLCEQGELACVVVLTSEDPDGFDYRCVGGVGPVAELCDGDDNDCDAEIDECVGDPASQAYMDCASDPVGAMGPAPFDQGAGARGGAECGADNPMCARGKLKCVQDVDSSNVDPNEPGLVCVGANFGMPETCNGVDDDCDLKIDENLDPADDPRLGQSCGDVGPNRCDVPPQEDPNDPSDDTLPCGQCRFGVQDCVGGMIQCIGAVGPDSFERCNLSDDDCDGQIDECVDPDDPAPECVGEIDPDTLVGQPCGGGAACSSGVNRCVDGVLECEGVDQGGVEVCNNLDDDCDGLVDEGFQKGLPCGQSEGECHPGVWACDGNGGRTCAGAVTPIDELCDNLDNDCDTRVDEGLGLGGECGTDEGLCEKGELACVNGQTVCSGEVGPQPETCDCEDNDCDGNVDEDTGENAVCPSGSACLMCQCALPCGAAVEFGAQCPQGKAPVESDGECYCVGQECNILECQAQTIDVGGEVRCAPDSDDVGSCLCRNNECTFRCAGVTCGDSLVCDPTDGRCKQRSCLLPQFRCSEDQRCTINEGVWQCVDDACADKECAEGEACRDGVCLASCAKVECSAGNRCQDGNCVRDHCQGVNCEPGLVCDPSNGSCVVAGACVANGCPGGEICDRVAGDCSEDPCLRTRCPYGEECNSETSECALRCASTLLYCGADACVNPMTSRTHCGASGNCQGENAGEVCEADLVCSRGQCSDTCADNLVNCGGECVDPQNNTRHCGASGSCQGERAGEQCRTGFTCTAGRCTSITGGEGGSGEPGGSDADDATRVIVSGGGGCTCSAVGAAEAPSAGSRRGAISMLLVLLALGWLGRRRVASPAAAHTARAAASMAIVMLASSILGSGCKVDAFCLDCPSPDDRPNPNQDGGGAGSGGGGGGGGAGPIDSGTADAQPPTDGAVDAGPTPDGGCLDRELCNGVDDDCDNVIDEGADPAELSIDVDTNVQHCGGCGQACGLAHAFNACVAGECRIDTTQGVGGCDIGYVNHDGDDANGCEYRCTKTADEDAICDLVDNDCDREIDEDVDLDNDPLHCGSCNDQCRLRRVEDGGECVGGACVIGTKDCEDGFANLDGDEANGCEHQCFAFPSTPEQCNGLDDDCDGEVDEGVDTTDADIGQPCGEDEGECVAGVVACDAGVEVCSGSVGPSPEVCDGLDNDCDGMVDLDHPQLGLPCGEATPGSQCSKGALQIPLAGCSGGVVLELECRGGQGPVAETCDGLDNDCDGRTDEAVDGVRPQAGQLCVNTATGVDIVTAHPPGECRAGTTECVSGNLLCRNEIAAAPYDLCDGLDRDCDGQAFTGYTFSGNIATAGPDPGMGESCGSDTGACAFGELRCHLDVAMLVCDNQTLPAIESCDGLDNDCDGRIDERPMSGSLPGENVACVTDPGGILNTAPPDSASEGECQTGVTVCSAGRLGCQGQIGPQPELCDELDHDCDGDPINDVAVTDPNVGDPCGPPTVGVCVRGTTVCMDGAPPTIVCADAQPDASYVPPAAGGTPEIACDGLDNDCDGATDEGDPAAYDGASCCDLQGFDCCDMGTRQCSNGRVACVYPVGARFPQNEACGDGPGGIGADDDCDGTADEGFSLLTDVNNCGECGNVCAPTVPDPHAVIVCSSGECTVGACVGNYVDADFDDDSATDADWQNGCETACTFTGNEICDGEDNDCNGTIDDLDNVPSAVCIPRQRGVCNDVPELLTLGPTCSGGALECDVQAVVDAGFISNYEAVETTCDGVDNDCDGLIDEGYNIGVPCNNGALGACRAEGVIECTGPGSAACNAPPAGSATAEVCDGLDNDCDNVVDNFGVPGPGNLVGNFEFVDLGASTGNTLVMAYEASRPDATDMLSGRITNKPCSVEGVRPWANVTWPEASAACCALNADGECSGDGQGWRLCDASTFAYTCQGPGQACTWAYSDSVSAVCDHAFDDSAFELVCHGAESTDDDVVSCAAGVGECSTLTGSSTFPECYANSVGGPVSDMSGNLQEWTNTALDTNIYAIRGGSYNDVEAGRACGFDFEVGSASFRFPTTGFRCCWYPPEPAATGETCVTYAATDLPGQGNENASPSVVHQIQVPDAGEITEIELLDMTGTQDRFGDLEFLLSSPQGTQIMLINNRCGTDDDWAFDLSDSASQAVTDGAFCNGGGPAGQGTGSAWQSETALSTFDGQQAMGAWTLTLNETSGTGAGGPTITAWNLRVCRATYEYVIP